MSKARTDPNVTRNKMHESESELRRGPWTLEEDTLLIQYITSHGEGRWNYLAKFAGLKRTGKSCRLRWLNYLKPDIKRGNLSPHEQILILELHSKWGNRWSKIAQHLPGRTDNEIKNYWRTRVQKQARQLKVDSNSKKFLEAIRSFWMSRLMEKIEQSSSSPSSSTSSSSSSISTLETQNCNNIITAPSPSLFTPGVNNSGSYIYPPETVSHSQLPENFTAGENPLEDDYYHVGFPRYDMQELDHAQHITLSECHVAGVDWFGDDSISSTFWNTDELWEFRK